MSRKFSLRDFGAGAVLGLVLGTAGLSAASFGMEGWNKFSHDFKVGYVTGFMSMANLARNLEPGGFIDTKYPLIPQAKPMEYVETIDRLYKTPDYQKYSIHSILQSASIQLEKKYGEAMPTDKRLQLRLQKQLLEAQKRREAAAAKAGKQPPSDPKHVEAPDKAVKEPVAKKAPAPKPPRKWCRCDGKNPKEERAKRRAAREEAQKAEAAKAPKPDGTPVPAAAAPGTDKKPPVPASN